MPARRNKRPTWARTAANSHAGARPRRRRACLWLSAIAASLVLVAATVALAFVLYPHGATDHRPRAAILDQLSATNANPALIESTESMLTQAGYRVDYFGPAQIDVNLFARLPSLGYEIVLVRSHSTGLTGNVNDATGAVDATGSLTSLFTNEPYSIDQHVGDQRDKTLDIVRIAQAVPGVQTASGANAVIDPDIHRYFGITPSFVTEHMKGRFSGTVILLMGCEAMRTPEMARAFESRGAASVIGWDGPVTPDHTDKATTSLLQGLIARGLTPQAAVDTTMRDVGKDPVYAASLVSG